MKIDPLIEQKKLLDVLVDDVEPGMMFYDAWDDRFYLIISVVPAIADAESAAVNVTLLCNSTLFTADAAITMQGWWRDKHVYVLDVP